MLTEREIWQLTKMTDVCVTSLIKHSEYNRPSYNAHKFTTTISLPQFDSIREVAFEIYTWMAEEVQFCPTVDQHELYGVAMTWRSTESHEDGSDRFVTITLDTGLDLRYRFGRKGKTAPNYSLRDPKKLPELIKSFSQYLNWQIDSIDKCRGR